MMVRRLRVNQQLRITAETADGMRFESPVRLRPGQVIELVWPGGTPERTRRACVESWSVAGLGSDGPMYGGRCCWQ
jgi:hypothetical protein